MFHLKNQISCPSSIASVRPNLQFLTSSRLCMVRLSSWMYAEGQRYWMRKLLAANENWQIRHRAVQIRRNNCNVWFNAARLGPTCCPYSVYLIRAWNAARAKCFDETCLIKPTVGLEYQGTLNWNDNLDFDCWAIFGRSQMPNALQSLVVVEMLTPHLPNAIISKINKGFKRRNVITRVQKLSLSSSIRCSDPPSRVWGIILWYADPMSIFKQRKNYNRKAHTFRSPDMSRENDQEHHI